MRNKILLPIASAVIASSLVFAVPAQAEENLVPTIVNEEVSTNEVGDVTVDTTVDAPVEATTDVTEDTTGESTEAVEVDVDTETVSEEVYEDIISEVEEEISVVDPDSFFYSFKVFFEEVRLFFTFDDEKKAELLAQLANERLLEADFAAEKGDLELVKELIVAYEAKIAELEELASDSESVTEETYADDSVIEETYGSGDSVTDETYNEDSYKLKNIAALTKVYNKVPDHVKPIIQRNIQKAIEKREAHIAKKQLKYSTTEDNVETETLTDVESENTNNTVEISEEEKAVSNEKVNKKQTSVEITEVESDESSTAKESKGNQGKAKGKDNKGNSGK